MAEFYEYIAATDARERVMNLRARVVTFLAGIDNGWDEQTMQIARDMLDGAMDDTFDVWLPVRVKGGS